jgi:hypothetical protein
VNISTSFEGWGASLGGTELLTEAGAALAIEKKLRHIVKAVERKATNMVLELMVIIVPQKL